MRIWIYFRYFFTCLLILLLYAGIAWADKVVYLSSLEWPPYTGKNLPDEGESSKIVREAFAAMGYKLEILFVPWKRGMIMTERNNRMIGFFPEYYSKERADKYIFSDPFGCSTIGLLQRISNPVEWERVSDLKGLRLGFVSGYVNTVELDKAIADKLIIADLAPHDESNIHKIVRGRVDGAVIDPRVYEYITTSSPSLRNRKEALQIHPKNFGVNKLFVVFKNDPVGRRYVKIFNRGLKTILANRPLGCNIDRPANESDD